MSGSTRKFFTVSEANAMLPLVRAIAQDLSNVSREVIERNERLALLREDEHDEPIAYREEVEQIEDELDKDKQQLQEYINELLALGVEPKNGVEGLIDFPAKFEGRTVYLCWKLDEPEVLYWHELDAGFAGRQSLSESAITGSNN